MYTSFEGLTIGGIGRGEISIQEQRDQPAEFAQPRKFHHVYDAIREDIVSLRLCPGTMIYENELAEQQGVSRTPVRDAIRLLVNEQLLEVLPQRGTRVARISESKVREARFVREQLELGGFRLAARLWHTGPSADGNQAAEWAIHQLLERQQEAADAGNVELFMQLDEGFHQAVLATTANQTLLQVIVQMRGHLNRIRMLALNRYHHMHRLVEEHRGIYEAVRQGNENGVAELLTRHMGRLDEELPELRAAYPAYFQP